MFNFRIVSKSKGSVVGEMIVNGILYDYIFFSNSTVTNTGVLASFTDGTNVSRSHYTMLASGRIVSALSNRSNY